MTERDAILKLKQGDINGLAVLVRHHQVRAVRTAYLITQDRGLAEDVVQAAFVRVYERIHQFDVSRPFAPWFYRIVSNAAIQAAQRRSRQLSLDATPARTSNGATFADLLPDMTPGPDAAVEQAERKDAVREALRQLTPEQRAAVVLRYYAGLTEREMADELDTPQGTIKWRLHAARKQLRVLLSRFSGDPVPEWQEG